MSMGIDQAHREMIANELKHLLADSYTLYLKTHYFHWNVTGPHFRDLHLLFEEQYTELATAVDDIAERIRTLGVFAPGTYREFAELSAIKEEAQLPKAMEMVALLAEAHEQVVQSCRKVLKVANEYDDESTSALVSDRMRLHEKTVWMLRSILD